MGVIFDQLTVSGAINSQALSYATAPYRLTTAAITTVTIATIAVPNNSAMALECTVLGRRSLNLNAEKNAFLVLNNGGTLTVTSPSSMLLVTGVYIWSNSAAGASVVSVTASGTNALVQISPLSTASTDWEVTIDTAVC